MDSHPSVELTLEEMAVVLALLDELISGRTPTEEVLDTARSTQEVLRRRSRSATA